MLKLLYGGLIVENVDVPGDYEDNHVWEIGEVLTIDAQGKLEKANGSTTGVIGLAMERRARPVGSDYSADQTHAAGKGSILTGEALVVVDTIVSGISISPNDVLYVSDDGRLTNEESDSKKKVGRVRSVNPDGTITLFFRPDL